MTLLWCSFPAPPSSSPLLRSRERGSLPARLERLTESYWELRYEYGQLRARVSRLEPDQAAAAPRPPAPAGSTAFVPLSSLKRKG